MNEEEAARLPLGERILEMADIVSEIVVVPEWGDAKIEVRSMSGLEKTDAMEQWTIVEGKERRVDDKKFYPTLLVQTCFDPDTGDRLWTKDQVARLNSKNSNAILRVVTIALRLSGMDEESRKDSGEASAETGV